jgi:hypothetical protein
MLQVQTSLPKTSEKPFNYSTRFIYGSRSSGKWSPRGEFEGWSTEFWGPQRVARPIDLNPIHNVCSVIKTYEVSGGWRVRYTDCATRSMTEKSKFDFTHLLCILLFSKTSKPALGVAHRPIRWGSEADFCGINWRWHEARKTPIFVSVYVKHTHKTKTKHEPGKTLVQQTTECSTHHITNSWHMNKMNNINSSGCTITWRLPIQVETYRTRRLFIVTVIMFTWNSLK